MTDPTERLNSLRRTRLLIRTARIGLPDYRRTSGIARMLAQGGIGALFEAEDRAETRRRSGDAAYGIAAHVDLLVALMAECQPLARMRDQEKASGSAALRRAT